ncbi:hypothetical protein BDV95DRAFT_590061 [Massariosphaeria phaeospora]|uniref:BZIP domain-containing protein n=1 Tax=Massariosphaeria phaeospora TaxID=100035 RepID=A0A7C8MI74_9PLEO|nr:hypothetical protein BDV95DRAFT_590061 [Massariosphaeria phaeospora]
MERMARKTDPSQDDWHNVQDSKKRKQIQDRLAQRARRKRLREAKNNSKHDAQLAETQAPDDAQPDDESQVATLGPAFHLVSQERLELSTLDLDGAGASLSSALSSVEFAPFVAETEPFWKTQYLQAIAPRLPVQTHFPLTIYGALYINGQILGIGCSTVVPARSTPCTPDIPPSLHPTQLQLLTIHARWIDRLPFPKMRDSLINLSGIIDEEEILQDIALIPSFTFVPGHAPWDPRAWKWEKPFADKWGYLLF